MDNDQYMENVRPTPANIVENGQYMEICGAHTCDHCRYRPIHSEFEQQRQNDQVLNQRLPLDAPVIRPAARTFPDVADPSHQRLLRIVLNGPSVDQYTLAGQMLAYVDLGLDVPSQLAPGLRNVAQHMERTSKFQRSLRNISELAMIQKRTSRV